MTPVLPEVEPTSSSQPEPVQTAPSLTRVSVELVPRSRTSLTSELAELRAELGNVQTVNIPDFLRYKMRSWEGCRMAREHLPEAIPHIRAIDINPREPLKMADFLRQHDIREVLIIEGDAPSDMSSHTFDVTSLDIIRKFRRELPEVTVWAGPRPLPPELRPRARLRRGQTGSGRSRLFYPAVLRPPTDGHLGRAAAHPAGVLGRHLGDHRAQPELLAKPQQGGVSQQLRADVWPATGPGRRDVLSFAQEVGGHVYFMPIKESVAAYLGGIL